MSILHSFFRRSRLLLMATRTGGLFLILIHVTTGFAQDPQPTNMKLQVLAWNENLSNLSVKSLPQPVKLSATRGRLSPVYSITTTSPLVIHRNGAAAGDASLVSVPFTEGLREGLLLLSMREGRIHGALMPFASKDFPKNSATIFNLTDSPVFAQVDGERIQIPAHKNHRITYEYVYAEKESLSTKFAVQYEGSMKLVQNGFIPLMNEGRILFFISDKVEKTGRAGENVVSFSYAYDVLRDSSTPPSDSSEAIKFEDLIQLEE